MKKAFDQTVRDLKREVNKKVLKVPSIEQKVLDATSNEPWGPHGSLLAEIAQSTRNYHEYQMIMSVLWKRISDTGKNWRHVYKALVVLDYLVAHGSERVIDDIREHAYQISTLSDFQYIDSSGRDQGNNVRKKSQSLVVLVSDKEKIQEARQKAAVNRDKFRSNQSANTSRPGFSSSGYGDRYDDDHYEGHYRDDERNGSGKERDWGSRDDDRYGRYSDSISNGDRYSRDAEDRYGRERYHDENRGRSQRVDDYHNVSRGKSADSNKNTTEDDGQFSSRGSGANVEDSQNGRIIDKKLDRKYSGQSAGAPPSYEDAVVSAQSPSYSERDGESSQAHVPNAAAAIPSHGVVYAATPADPSPVSTLSSPPATTHSTVQLGGSDVDADEFDPRSLVPAAPAPSSLEVDLLGSLESYSVNSLALVPAGQSTTPEADAPANLTSGTTVAASQASSTMNSQPSDDPFGDAPFKAVASAGSVLGQQHISVSSVSFNASSNQGQEAPPIPLGTPTEIVGLSYDATYMPRGPPGVLPPTTTQLLQQELTSAIEDVDILAGILPPAPTTLPEAQAAYHIAPIQSLSQSNFIPEANQPLQSGSASVIAQNAQQNGFQTQAGPANFAAQLAQPSMLTGHALMSAQPMLNTGFANQPMGFAYPVQTGHYSQVGFPSQGAAAQTSQMGFPSQAGSVQPISTTNTNVYGAYIHQPISTGQSAAYAAPPGSTMVAFQNNFVAQRGSAVPMASQIGQHFPQAQSVSITAPASTGVFTQPSEDKFKTKSSVWADTLSRGLVNLNISGPKANPLADIGVDFDSINRKEKRMEKPTIASVASTITMGKAMGAGSGMGRTGAGALRPPSNPMVSSMAGGMGPGYYGVSQPMGRGMPMNIRMDMHQQAQFPPGTTMPGGGYKMGNYGQLPYGGAYR